MINMFNRVLFSSLSPEWKTPYGVFHSLDNEFHFDLDAAANRSNALCKSFLTDGLNEKWFGNVFCNPPYSRSLGSWIKKAYDSVFLGYCNIAVLLIPARTDTKWFHEYVLPLATDIRFLRGRLHFNDSKNAAPFPSMIVVFSRGRV